MSTYYYAKNLDGKYLYDNFPAGCTDLIENFKHSEKILEIKIDGTAYKARIGKKETRFGTIYVLSTEEKHINKYKTFKELVDISSVALKPINDLQNQIREQLSQQTDEFIHNLTSLNTYSIQDLFKLIPQNLLAENINKQQDAIKNILSIKTAEAAKTLLRLIRFSLSTKVEFSVYERTLKPHAVAQKMEYPIRPLILYSLQIFADEFAAKNIELQVDAGENSEKRLLLDHDSLLVSLYYLFDNAVKYCCPYTDFKIYFMEESDCFSVTFKMVSLRIEPDEVNRLTERGFRSANAKRINSTGGGIGMFRIVRTLGFNNAQLTINPRTFEFKKYIGGETYEGNSFKIKFAGQQDWFKVNMR